MKELVVRNQVVLGPGRCFALCVEGISYRLFRSLVTVAILVLAVTFLMQGLSYSLIEARVRAFAGEELSESRLLNQWLVKMTAADDEPTIYGHLARHDAGAMAEYRKWSGASDAEMAEGERIAQKLKAWEAWLAALPETEQVILSRGQDDLALLRELRDEEKFGQFKAQLENDLIGMPLDDEAAFKALVMQEMGELEGLADRIKEGQIQAIAALQKTAGAEGLLGWLADEKNDVKGELTKLGYTVDDGLVKVLRHGAAIDMVMHEFAAAVTVETTRAEMIRLMDVKAEDYDVQKALAWMDSLDRAKEVEAMLKEKVPGMAGAKLSGEELKAMSDRYAYQLYLRGIAGATTEGEGGLFGMTRRMQWLVLLAFVVCMVGVMNAMFMSVTERFAEIATMKCLGALDGFLLMLFLFESALQGMVGGAIGIVLGGLLATGRGWMEFGGLVFKTFPVGSMMISAGVALGAGLVIAVFAALGPAWMAARLLPMEAMRID